MQRWIVVAVVGALLVGVGGGLALWNYRENRPKAVWVPLVLNPEFPEEKREPEAERLKEKLLAGTIISDVVKDTGLAAKLKMSPAEAEADAKKRFFVKVGEAAGPNAVNVPSINVGFNCQRKTYGAYGEVAMRLRKDVWKIMGIPEPQSPMF